jgi:hypothetical protein
MTAGMTSANGEGRSTTPPAAARRPVSALPSVQARILAFAAILVAGISGGLIGFSAVKVGCGTRTTATTATGAVAKNCSTPEGVGGVAGAVIAAAGVAVIAVLVLRAMGEWRTIREKRELEALTALPAETVPVSTHAAAPSADLETLEPGATGEPPHADRAPEPPAEPG